jgi:hypothetical protein
MHQNKPTTQNTPKTKTLQTKGLIKLKQIKIHNHENQIPKIKTPIQNHTPINLLNEALKNKKFTPYKKAKVIKKQITSSR